jgi:hypothetical protein
MKEYIRILAESLEHDVSDELRKPQYYTQEDILELFEALELDTHKYNFEYLAEQLGFTTLNEKKPKNQHRESRVDEQGNLIHDLYMDDEVVFSSKDKADIHKLLWNDNNESSTDDEIMSKLNAKKVVKESYTREDLEQLFEALELDTDKYTFGYLAEELGFTQLNERGSRAQLRRIEAAEKQGFPSDKYGKEKLVSLVRGGNYGAAMANSQKEFKFKPIDPRDIGKPLYAKNIIKGDPEEMGKSIIGDPRYVRYLRNAGKHAYDQANFKLDLEKKANNAETEEDAQRYKSKADSYKFDPELVKNEMKWLKSQREKREKEYRK